MKRMESLLSRMRLSSHELNESMNSTTIKPFKNEVMLSREDLHEYE
jgi:hypothetical protein